MKQHSWHALVYGLGGGGVWWGGAQTYQCQLFIQRKLVSQRSAHIRNCYLKSEHVVITAYPVEMSKGQWC